VIADIPVRTLSAMTGREQVQQTTSLFDLFSDHQRASARQIINSRNVFQASIPIRAARDKNMGVRLSIDRRIEASSRDDQQSPIHLNTRKC
jgi:hypothetical protein